MKGICLLFLVISVIYCDESVRIEVSDIHGAYGSEAELVNIDLKHKNPNTNGIDDINIQVKVFFHLVNNQVHCNGVPLVHQQVTHLHMQMVLREIHSGEEVQNEREVPVELRIFVADRVVNGKHLLIVEQNFLLVDNVEVEQIIIQKIIWEDYVRKPIVPVEYSNTELSQQDEKNDMHVHRAKHLLPAHLPNHPFMQGEPTDQHWHHHHHHRHHHGLRGIKCWFKHLHKRSKIAVITGSALLLIAVIFAIACCVRRKQRKSKTLMIASPMDDEVQVDYIDEKKDMKQNDDEKYDFHFEVDNSVVVDDKKELIK